MPKRIVVFCDGTWKKADDVRFTNVVKIMRAVKATAGDGKPQISFYDPGVGTESPVRRIVGGAFGVGLSTNVRDGYRFIANNYEEGDEIYLFGFSRGAYTARSLGGMISELGLFYKHEMNRFGELADAYQATKTSVSDNADLVKKIENARQYQRPRPQIKFIGVWDTVGARGIPVGFLDRLAAKLYDFKKFYDVQLNTDISHAYHAVAIDERRGPFKATMWEDVRAEDVETVEQVWFSGVHTNVGGGYPKDGLENCALHWMATKAIKHGLDLDSGYLAAFKADPTDKLYNSRKGGYRLIRPSVRDVDWRDFAGVAIHESVLKRLQAKADYRPEKLIRGLEVHPVVDNDGNVVRSPGPYTD